MVHPPRVLAATAYAWAASSGLAYASACCSTAGGFLPVLFNTRSTLWEGMGWPSTGSPPRQAGCGDSADWPFWVKATFQVRSPSILAAHLRGQQGSVGEQRIRVRLRRRRAAAVRGVGVGRARWAPPRGPPTPGSDSAPCSRCARPRTTTAATTPISRPSLLRSPGVCSSSSSRSSSATLHPRTGRGPRQDGRRVLVAGPPAGSSGSAPSFRAGPAEDLRLVVRTGRSYGRLVLGVVRRRPSLVPVQRLGCVLVEFDRRTGIPGVAGGRNGRGLRLGGLVPMGSPRTVGPLVLVNHPAGTPTARVCPPAVRTGTDE